MTFCCWLNGEGSKMSNTVVEQFVFIVAKAFISNYHLNKSSIYHPNITMLAKIYEKYKTTIHQNLKISKRVDNLVWTWIVKNKRSFTTSITDQWTEIIIN